MYEFSFLLKFSQNPLTWNAFKSETLEANDHFHAQIQKNNFHID